MSDAQQPLVPPTPPTPRTPPAPPPPAPVARREIFGWAMFDFANSSYTTIVVTIAFGVYFTTLVAPGERGDALWGLGLTVSNLLAMVLAPVVGAVADGAARKKAFLAATYLLCVAGTASLYFAVPGQIVLALSLFVVSNLAFSLGENLVAAFLPEISTPKNIGRISGLGWGVGYFGGLLTIAAVYPFVAGGYTLENLDRLRLAWPVTGLFFLVAGIPTFLFLKERALPTPGRSWAGYAADGLARIATTAREIRHFAQLGRFLVAFFFFYAGLTIVVAFAGIYAVRTLGFTTGEQFLLFVVVNVSAALGALGFGAVQDRLGAKRTVQITLVLWIGVCVGAWLATTKGAFWGVAVASGLGIGSLQSASRALIGLFSPTEKSGEFFGFWGLAGKAAYAVGPAAFGLVSVGTGSQRTAILATALFFIAGLVGLGWVDEAAGRRAAEQWDERERAADSGLSGAPPGGEAL